MKAKIKAPQNVVVRYGPPEDVRSYVRILSNGSCSGCAFWGSPACGDMLCRRLVRPDGIFPDWIFVRVK